MQRFTYVPVTINTHQFQQSQLQTNLNQTNAFRNISIPKRRQEQYSNQTDRRKSVDLSIYQYRNNLQQAQYQYVQPAQQYQQHHQIFQIQQRESSLDKHRKNLLYPGQIQNISFLENSQIQNHNFAFNQYGTSQNQQNNTHQVISFPQQLSQTNPIKQYDSSQMRYELIPHSNKHQDDITFEQQRDLKQINSNLSNRRYSIDSAQVQVDQKQGVSEFYIKNNFNNTGYHEQIIKTNSSASTNTPQTRFNNLGGYRIDVFNNQNDQQQNQNYSDRYFNNSLNGSFSNNSTMNQYQDTNKLNSSLNSSFSHDINYVKPRSNSLAVQHKIDQQYCNQPANLIVQNHQQQPSLNTQQNMFQNYDSKYGGYSLIYNQSAHENQNKLESQNLRILQPNISNQNQQKPMIPNQYRQISKELHRYAQNPSEQRSYFSETMQRDSNNSQRQFNQEIIIDKNSHDQQSKDKDSNIHIKSVEFFQEEEQNIQDKNEQFEINGNDNIKTINQINTQQNNSNKNTTLNNKNAKIQQQQEKENINQRSPQLLTNRSSVIIEYNEIYKQDRIPISHGISQDSKINDDNNNSIKPSQPKINTSTTDIPQQPPSKLSYLKRTVPHANLTDVKNLVNQQVQKIQKECKENYQNESLDQQQQNSYSIKIKEKGIQSRVNNYISHSAPAKDDRLQSLNINKPHQNVDTTLNHNNELELSNSDLRTPQKGQNKQIYLQNNSTQGLYIKPDQDKNNICQQIKTNNENRPEQRNEELVQDRRFQDGKESQQIDQKANINKYNKQDNSIKVNKPTLQYPTPPSTELNGKTTFYHKKNICRIAETFTFNTNLSSTQTQETIDINNTSSQDVNNIKSGFRKNNQITKAPIDQIRRNQQQIFEVPETSSSYLFQNQKSDCSQTLQGNNYQLENTEKPYKRILNSQQNYQNGQIKFSKFVKKSEYQNGDDMNEQKTTNTYFNQQDKLSTIKQNNSKQFLQSEIAKNDKQAIQNLIFTNTPVEEKQLYMKDQISNNQIKSFSIQSYSIQNEKMQDNKDETKQIQKENELKKTNTPNKKYSMNIGEKIIEDYSDSLYWQLNIERSLLQLKTGLGRKMNEIVLILPQYQKEANDFGELVQQYENIQLYGIRLNKILSTNYSEEEFKQIFTNHKLKNTQNELQQIQKEEVLEVLLGIQNLTVTQKASEINEETKKIIRNIMKETLRAETNFNEIRQRFFKFQNELFLYISNGNNDLITYSDFKSFLIKNGYQVRDQEMMLLINRFHRPNSIRLNLQQFIMN